MHLLKMVHRPNKAAESWRSTVIREWLDMEQYLEGGPGLKPRRRDLFEQAYRAARREAAAETGLPAERFPVAPFTVDEVEAEDFWPRPAP